jgi:16S rRNA (cytosine967-C5)-methyltransferase
VRDTPKWLLARWSKHYGADTARAIAQADGHEPALDLTVKSGAETWAERLRGRVLPTGTVRTLAQGAISLLPGFREGAWWVQDAAASLPARLFGDVRGKAVADLCAAPGGKTAQLAFAGARVTAIDRSPARLGRLRENLTRLELHADIVAADALEWQSGPFDAVLLDAPCSATGTIRRHPDIPWLKSEADIAALTSLQQRLLDRAVDLLKPGGTLVYCVCSLEPEESEAQIAALLARDPRVARAPDAAQEVAGHAEFLNPDGDLRTLPPQLPDPDPRWGGLDGFYAARLTRTV